jgi:hypothetical protein
MSCFCLRLQLVNEVYCVLFLDFSKSPPVAKVQLKNKKNKKSTKAKLKIVSPKWALAQVLPDIIITFCLSLIVGKTAREKLQATFRGFAFGRVFEAQKLVLLLMFN